MQDPQQYYHRSYCNTKENDSSIVMEPPGKEARVYSSSEFADRDDAETILGY